MNKLEKIKYDFDTITSNNSKNWKLVLFWIIVFEIFASLFEYFTIDNAKIFLFEIHSSPFTGFIIGLSLTLFVWYIVYNFIYWNKTNFLILILFTIIGIYLFITDDLAFTFIAHNLNALYLIQSTFGVNFIIQLSFKLIIAYLIYQLIISLKIQNR